VQVDYNYLRGAHVYLGLISMINMDAMDSLPN